MSEPGDVIFCKASLLERAIGPWEGVRVSFVVTRKQDVTKLTMMVVQNDRCVPVQELSSLLCLHELWLLVVR